MAVRATIRTPMPVKMRAKQFMMFDAMKGLTEAIAEKERQLYPQKELTEDRIAELSGKLSALRVGDTVTIEYYCQYAKNYTQMTGIISRIDAFWKTIQINEKTIDFCEIDSITN
ncbi:MAG: YolD-like family protein [Oscillospiraceae bacterium]|nr:YolD-like family protein [Oscillospiraceae bacterium]